MALGNTIELAVHGGSALALCFDWRAATKDVDAVYEDDREIVRRLVSFIASERGWPSDWLNDGVRGFLSPRDRDESVRILSREFPSTAEPGLRVFVPTPEYLFAMKCRAMRLGGSDSNRDMEDIRMLAVEIGIDSVETALAIVSSFYPHSQLQPKVQFGLEEIFSTLPTINAAPGFGGRST